MPYVFIYFLTFGHQEILRWIGKSFPLQSLHSALTVIVPWRAVLVGMASMVSRYAELNKSGQESKTVLGTLA